jgi:RimJ/RimL family protein N-acetyltransferase
VPGGRVNRGALRAPVHSARLVLEPFRPDHAQALFDGLKDPRIYEWIALAPPRSVERLRTRLAEAVREREGDEIDLAWVAIRTVDGTCVGKLDATVLARGIATNVGYMFFPPHWRQGYASEAVRALADHLAAAGVRVQHATVTVGNEASCRVLERAGFVRRRVLAGNDTIRGQVVDDIEYVRRDGGRMAWRWPAGT